MAGCSTITIFSVVLTAFGASAAGAQNADNYATKQYQAPPPQQAGKTKAAPPADAKRAAAEAERAAATAEAQRSVTAGGVGFNTTYVSSFHIPAKITDDFARMAAPVYLLPNGVKLRTSGDFRPSDAVRCVLYCENARRP
jgi:hypothetical protein